MIFIIFSILCGYPPVNVKNMKIFVSKFMIVAQCDNKALIY